MLLPQGSAGPTLVFTRKSILSLPTFWKCRKTPGKWNLRGLSWKGEWSKIPSTGLESSSSRFLGKSPSGARPCYTPFLQRRVENGGCAPLPFVPEGAWSGSYPTSAPALCKLILILDDYIGVTSFISKNILMR